MRAAGQSRARGGIPISWLRRLRGLVELVELAWNLGIPHVHRVERKSLR